MTNHVYATMRRLRSEDHLWKKINLKEVGNEFLYRHAGFMNGNQMVSIGEYHEEEQIDDDVHMGT